MNSDTLVDMCKIIVNISSCDNTIKGEGLDISKYKEIHEKFKMLNDERIEIIYLFQGNFVNINVNNDIYVGITTYQVFKCDKNNKTSVMISNIKSVSHQKNSIFRWDKLVCKKINDTTETFGIYHKKTCVYFCKYLLNKIETSKMINPIHHNTNTENSVNQIDKIDKINQTKKIAYTVEITDIPNQKDETRKVDQVDQVDPINQKDSLQTDPKQIAQNQTTICLPKNHTNKMHKSITNPNANIIKKNENRLHEDFCIESIDNLKVTGLRSLCEKYNISVLNCRYRADYIKIIKEYKKQNNIY